MDLRYYPYKLSLVQQLLPDDLDLDCQQTFALLFFARLEIQGECPINILWTDEAHFHLEDSATRSITVFGLVQTYINPDKFYYTLRKTVARWYKTNFCMSDETTDLHSTGKSSIPQHEIDVVSELLSVGHRPKDIR
ncbi:hypothetical protein TNCV_5091551 [Trichonephila clavipes]|nr:hypothetical protein TNCV_5091551 [Trichonephila clavipes]